MSDRRRSDAPHVRRELVEGYSLEMTGKDTGALAASADILPLETRVNVTFLGSESLDVRVAAASAVAASGFIPVPHISARRIGTPAQLEEYLERLQEVGASERVLIVGGDPATPAGPYDSAVQVIESGLLQRYGVAEVGIAGYPEGHPSIPTEVLKLHLDRKAAALRDAGLRATIMTQFSFDADAVAAWIRDVRSRGHDAPIRVGVPGPAGIARLLDYARRFGIGANAMIVKKYGLSLTKLRGTAGPDRFVDALAHHVATDDSAGDIRLHLYTFGGLRASAEWARNYAKRNES